MNLIQRYQPSLSWVDELDRLFDRTLRTLTSTSHQDETVHESDEAWILRVDLPGFRREDVSMKVSDGNLVLSAGTPSDRPFGGKMERQWKLGPQVDAAGIRAKLQHGVLELTLPKRSPEASQPITIEVR
jgi:HSP20 family protein